MLLFVPKEGVANVAALMDVQWGGKNKRQQIIVTPWVGICRVAGVVESLDDGRVFRVRAVLGHIAYNLIKFGTITAQPLDLVGGLMQKVLGMKPSGVFAQPLYYVSHRRGLPWEALPGERDSP